MAKQPTPAAGSPLAARQSETKAVADQWLVPTNPQGLGRLGDMILEQINKSLPKMLAGNGSRLVRALVSEVQRNPALMECVPISLFGGVIAAGQLGLTIGGPAGEAYLLPFRNNKTGRREATLVIGYKGYIALAHRSDKLARITPQIVREGDVFHYTRGLNQKLVHEPKPDNDGKPTHFYTVIQMVNGGKDFEILSVREAKAHRERFATSRSGGPWWDMVKGGFEEMALKTTIRKFAKRMPLSAEMVTASGLDEMGDEGIDQHLKVYLPPDIAAKLPDAPAEQYEPTPGAEADTPVILNGDGSLFSGGDPDLSALKN